MDATSGSTLLALLEEIDALVDLPEDNPERVLNNIENADIKNLIRQIEYEADKFLITKEGACRWENHEWLGEKGYSVFCGERDRFGWLTGCIQTKKGVIVYG